MRYGTAVRGGHRAQSRPSGAVGTLVEVPQSNPESSSFQAYRGSRPPRFVNAAELECARILDWYRIPWEYEPRSFVLERDPDGRVTSAFTPDFYLPEQDPLHRGDGDEAITCHPQEPQAPRGPAPHPDVNVKLFYRRDIERLAQRYRLRIAS